MAEKRREPKLFQNPSLGDLEYGVVMDRKAERHNKKTDV
jgi:hypothetical protein